MLFFFFFSFSFNRLWVSFEVVNFLGKVRDTWGFTFGGFESRICSSIPEGKSVGKGPVRINFLLGETIFLTYL